MRRRLFDLARRASNVLFGPELLHRSPLARALFDAVASVVRALSPAHRRMRAFQRANPEAPWLVPASIPAIEALLRPGMRVFEWGAGRSTLWLARQGVRLISVEGRPGWHVAVGHMLAKHPGLSVDLRLVEVERDFDVPVATVARYAGAIAAEPDHGFDLILVDGHFRAPCIRASLAKVRPGGHLVIDNADTADVRDLIELLRPRRVGLYDDGICQTMIFRAPETGFASSRAIPATSSTGQFQALTSRYVL